MNNYFVSYVYILGGIETFGFAEASIDGIYSLKDLNKLVKIIKLKIQNELGIKGNIDVVILNWRKFDPTP